LLIDFENNKQKNYNITSQFLLFAFENNKQYNYNILQAFAVGLPKKRPAFFCERLP
jgi:hypothetical protein